MNILGFKIKDTLTNKVLVFLIIFILGYLVIRFILGILKDWGNKLEYGTPSERDYSNAKTIKDAFNSEWTELIFNDWVIKYFVDSEKIAQIVLQYNKETYPMLKTAYYDLYKNDLTTKLKNHLDSDELGKIINIIS